MADKQSEKIDYSEDGGDEEWSDNDSQTSSYDAYPSALTSSVNFVKKFHRSITKFRESPRNQLSAALKAIDFRTVFPQIFDKSWIQSHAIQVLNMTDESYKYMHLQQKIMEDFANSQEFEAKQNAQLKKRMKTKAQLRSRVRDMKKEADSIINSQISQNKEIERKTLAAAKEAAKLRENDKAILATEKMNMEIRKMNKQYWDRQYKIATINQSKLQSTSLQPERNEFINTTSDCHIKMSECGRIQHITSLPHACNIGSITAEDDKSHSGFVEDSKMTQEFDENDVCTMGIFASDSININHEKLRFRYMEAESVVIKLQCELQQTKATRLHLETNAQAISDKKEYLESTIKHLKSDHASLQSYLAGPPRRDASHEDIMTFHSIVTRMSATKFELQDILKRESSIQKRLQMVDNFRIISTQKLEDAEQHLKIAAQELNTAMADLVDLPAIVGRSIFPQSNAETVHENPQRKASYVEISSKLAILQREVQQTVKIRQESRTLAVANWKASLDLDLKSNEFERSKNMLTDIKKHIECHENASQRTELMIAIRNFHEVSNKLRPSVQLLISSFDLWSCRDPLKCNGAFYNENDNIISISCANSVGGQLQGKMILPKCGQYRFTLQILVQSYVYITGCWTYVDDKAAINFSGYSLFLGRTYDTMQEKTLRDKLGRASKIGELTADCYGQTVCFCFKFRQIPDTASKLKNLKLLIKNTVAYEEQLSDLSSESNFTKGSPRIGWTKEFGHNIRSQESLLNSEYSRFMLLLNELLCAEQSINKSWDSTLFHGYKQRYLRNEFILLMQKELKSEKIRLINQRVKDLSSEIMQQQQSNKYMPSAHTTLHISRIHFVDRKMSSSRVRDAIQNLGMLCRNKSGNKFANVGLHHCTTCLSVIQGISFEWSNGSGELILSQKLDDPHLSQWEFSESTHTSFFDNSFEEQTVIQYFRPEVAKSNEAGLKITELNRQKALNTGVEIAKDEVNYQERQRLRDLELASRTKQFYADAIRTMTYNPKIASVIETDAKMQTALLLQDGKFIGRETFIFEQERRKRQDEFISTFVRGKLTLIKKKWEKKEIRMRHQSVAERCTQGIVKQRVEENTYSALEIMSTIPINTNIVPKEKLKIQGFDSAISGRHPCEHKKIKIVAGKYSLAHKCASCQKDMALAMGNPLQTGLGASTDDSDCQNEGCGQVNELHINCHQFLNAERERYRLGKERAEMDDCEALLYDRLYPKTIEEFNLRHGIKDENHMDHDTDLSNCLLYRHKENIHRGYYQDLVLFNGRVKNFKHRIQKLTTLIEDVQSQIATEVLFNSENRDDLDMLRAQLALVERDYTIAVNLQQQHEDSRNKLKEARQKRIQAIQLHDEAIRALDGLQAKVELSEKHAKVLSIVKSDMMIDIQRIKEHCIPVIHNLQKTKLRLLQCKKTQLMYAHLLFRLRFQYSGTYIRTKYGLAKVISYRQSDFMVISDMIMWQGRLHLHVDEAAMYEEHIENSERKMMQFEDNWVRMVKISANNRESQEHKKMREEELATVDLVKWSNYTTHVGERLAKSLSIEEVRLQVEYELVQKRKLQLQAEAEVLQLNTVGRVSIARQRHRIYPGKLGLLKPKIHGINYAARANEKQLARAYIEESLIKSDHELRASMAMEIKQNIVSCFSESIFADMISLIIRSAICEVKHEEKSIYYLYSTVPSGVGIPRYILPTNHKLACVTFNRLWCTRKKQAEIYANVWSVQSNRLQLLEKELQRREKIYLAEEAVRMELEKRCSDMLIEENLCKKFYADERKLTQLEKNNMYRIEQEMREYLRQIQLYSVKSNKYSVLNIDKGAVGKAARRLEVKSATVDKHRLQREWILITEEDMLGSELRRQTELTAAAEAKKRAIEIFLIEQVLLGQPTDKFIEFDENMNRIRLLIENAKRKKKLEIEQQANERVIACLNVFGKFACFEHERLVLEEAIYFHELKTPKLKATIKHMQHEFGQVCTNEEFMHRCANANRGKFALFQNNLIEAEKNLQNASKEESAAKINFAHSEKFTSRMDSSVVHHRVQRFQTQYLLDKLNRQYFTMIINLLAITAIEISSKRKISSLESQRMSLERELKEKICLVQKVKHKQRRNYYMHMKRSHLGSLIFGKSQSRTLLIFFRQWSEYTTRYQVVRADFALRHSLILQQHRAAKLMQATDIPSSVDSPSILHTQQKRPIQCRLCKTKYTEEQNHRYACSYHPGEFEVACVHTCVTRTNSSNNTLSAVASSCMVHRTRRWLCCDSTTEGRYGSSGCANRYHLPMRNNPFLSAIVTQKNEEENALISKFNHRILDLQKRNVKGKIVSTSRDTLKKVHATLAKKRSIISNSNNDENY